MRRPGLVVARTGEMSEGGYRGEWFGGSEIMRSRQSLANGHEACAGGPTHDHIGSQ